MLTIQPEKVTYVPTYIPSKTAYRTVTKPGYWIYGTKTIPGYWRYGSKYIPGKTERIRIKTGSTYRYVTRYTPSRTVPTRTWVAARTVPNNQWVSAKEVKVPYTIPGHMENVRTVTPGYTRRYEEVIEAHTIMIHHDAKEVTREVQVPPEKVVTKVLVTPERYEPIVKEVGHFETQKIWIADPVSVDDEGSSDSESDETSGDTSEVTSGENNEDPLNFDEYDENTEDNQIDLENIWDDVTKNRLLSLHPGIRDNAIAFILAAQDQNIFLRVTCGYRTIEEQNALYEKGRTIEGNIVTNAKGGESYHNYGLALDVVPIVNGEAVWNCDWNEIGEIGKSCGFEWGGDWTSIIDKPHFQIDFGFSVSELMQKINDLENGYVKLE